MWSRRAVFFVQPLGHRLEPSPSDSRWILCELLLNPLINSTAIPASAPRREASRCGKHPLPNRPPNPRPTPLNAVSYLLNTQQAWRLLPGVLHCFHEYLFIKVDRPTLPVSQSHFMGRNGTVLCAVVFSCVQYRAPVVGPVCEKERPLSWGESGLKPRIAIRRFSSLNPLDQAGLCHAQGLRAAHDHVVQYPHIDKR